MLGKADAAHSDRLMPGGKSQPFRSELETPDVLRIGADEQHASRFLLGESEVVTAVSRDDARSKRSDPGDR